MLPNMNPSQMAKMMRSMGIKTKEISATRIVIECENENIIIDNPSVTEIDMKGQKSYQVGGTPRIESKIPDEDIKMVVEQTAVDEKTARDILIKNDGDIAKAIMDIKEKD